MRSLLISEYFIVSLTFDVLLKTSSGVFTASFRTVKGGVVFLLHDHSVVTYVRPSSTPSFIFVSSNQPLGHKYQLQTSFSTLSLFPAAVERFTSRAPIPNADLHNYTGVSQSGLRLTSTAVASVGSLTCLSWSSRISLAVQWLTLVSSSIFLFTWK